MNRILRINIFVITAIAGAGLLAIQAVNRSSSEASEHRFSEQVNLALRQTAHRLLAQEGDRSSRIPPVLHTGPHTWLVRLEHNFNYDSLPSVLQEAFALYRVEGDYNVAVLDCSNSDLMLGYTTSLQTANKDIPCLGREQTPGCYNLSVTFLDRASTPFPNKGVWLLLAVICVAMLVYPAYSLFFLLKKKYQADKPLPAGADDFTGMEGRNAALNENSSFQIGKSTLFTGNQKLVCNGSEKDLTYREAKLLQLFCRHANQLLERDLILKSVWEDEGIIVGRSVDVFVSRLRKLLKDDDSVRIVNVHGVGYRLEVEG